MLAAQSHFKPVVEILLDQGAETDAIAVDQGNRTALHWLASSAGPADHDGDDACKQILEWLLEASIKVRLAACQVPFTCMHCQMLN
jgi:hypothetical protein